MLMFSISLLHENGIMHKYILRTLNHGNSWIQWTIAHWLFKSLSNCKPCMLWAFVQNSNYCWLHIPLIYALAYKIIQCPFSLMECKKKLNHICVTYSLQFKDNKKDLHNIDEKRINNSTLHLKVDPIDLNKFNRQIIIIR